MALKQEANDRPNVFKWWGRRPLALVRGFLSLIVGASEELALKVASGDPQAIRKVRGLVGGRRLLDPFAGSGVIPVEAARLGFYAVGQDVNPYAVSIAEAYSDICNGSCSHVINCLWDSLHRSWRRIRGLWCMGSSCIIHVLLARCPPCKAPMWVSSLRSGGRIRKALVISRDNYLLEWRDPQGLSPSEPQVLLPANLPEEAPGYVAYALEYYKEGSRRWVSLASKTSEAIVWRRFLEDTSRLARSIAFSAGGVVIPVGEETLRLFKRGIKSTLGLLTWRQAATYVLIARESSACRREMALLLANTMQSGSLLAMYYQPLAKVNPGLVMKTYWIPRNPVELNPLANDMMPNPPSKNSRQIGRGTLISFLHKYEKACFTNGVCDNTPVILVGDSTKGVPGDDYDVIATDPPYPGLHTYKDMSLLYAHASLIANLDVNQSWEEIDTRDPEQYKDNIIKVFENSLIRSKPKAFFLLFISSPKPKGISIIAEILERLVSLGVGLQGIYPVIGENPGVLGRSTSKIVFIIIGKRGAPLSPNLLDPLLYARDIAENVGLEGRDIRYAELLSKILGDTLSIKLAIKY